MPLSFSVIFIFSFNFLSRYNSSQSLIYAYKPKSLTVFKTIEYEFNDTLYLPSGVFFAISSPACFPAIIPKIHNAICIIKSTQYETSFNLLGSKYACVIDKTMIIAVQATMDKEEYMVFLVMPYFSIFPLIKDLFILF